MNAGSTLTSSFALIVTLTALAGCKRVDLARLPVSSMTATLAGDPAVPPGGRANLIVRFVQPSGKVLATTGKGKGEVRWSDLKLTSDLVEVSRKGKVTLSDDPRLSDGRTAHLEVTVPTHPDLHAQLEIPVTYARAFQANFSGADGSKGADGSAGVAGSAGTVGSFDPDHPSAGGNGGNGGNGTDGERGGNGGDAPNVEVRVTLRALPHPLLQATVSANGRLQYFLIDPQSGSLTISAGGGSGGDGGAGGRGGSGGTGGAGNPAGTNGNAGRSGSNGLSGSSGRNGTVTVLYDASVSPYLTVMKVQGGRADYRQTAVGSLW